MTSARFKIGHVSRHEIMDDITLARRTFWSGYINKFHGKFPGQGSSGASPEVSFRRSGTTYGNISRAKLREA